MPVSNACSPFAWYSTIGRRISESFQFFFNKIDRLSASQLQGVHMNDIPIVEYLLTLNILQYGIDIVAGSNIGEIARGSVQRYENTV